MPRLDGANDVPAPHAPPSVWMLSSRPAIGLDGSVAAPQVSCIGTLPTPSLGPDLIVKLGRGAVGASFVTVTEVLRTGRGPGCCP